MMMIEPKRFLKFQLPFRLFLLLAQIVLVFSFLWSSWTHLNNQFFFIKSIADYQLVGGNTSIFLAVVLPILHMCLGVMLLDGKWLQFGAEVAAVLLFFYLAAQLSVLISGKQVGCSCFAFDDTPIGVYSMVRTSLLFALAFTLAFFYRRNRSSRILNGRADSLNLNDLGTG